MATVTPALDLRERSRFLAVAALAPATLLLGHLLPATGPGLALRLAGAAACVLLLPGALVLRALGWPSSLGVAVAASFAFSLAVATAGLLLVFAAGSSIMLALAVSAIVAVCAAVASALRGDPTPVPRGERRAVAAVLGAAIPYAGVVWWSSGVIGGDGPFHLARARKLAELDTLSTLTTVSEFKDGGIHVGYAFPLWQAVSALVARLGGVDVADVLVYLPAILVPLAFVLAYGAGSAVFGSRVGGLVLVVAQAAYWGFSWRGGNLAGTGFFENLSHPQAASHLLVTTALLALVFAYVTGGSWVLLAAVGCAALALTVVHPTYTPFVALLLGGFMVARVVLIRGWEPVLTRTVFALGGVLVPIALYAILFFGAVRETGSWTPSAANRARELIHYGNAFTTVGDWFILSPSAIARGGAVVVAGLLAVPLAGLAGRRLWAALVLGGSLAILIVVLVPPLFTALSDAFSIAQSRRLPQFLPIAFAVAGACLLVSRFRAKGVALAAGVGLVLALLVPGEFTYFYGEGGPGWTVWLALGGGLVALAVGAFLRSREPDPSVWAAAAALCFVLPVAVAGLSGLSRPSERTKLTPEVIAALRAETAPGDVVFSDRKTAYIIAGFAPVYINASSPGHVMETPKNRPRARAAAAWRFFYSRTATDADRRRILDRADADWVFVDKERSHPEEFLGSLRLAYEDDRFALYDARAGA